MESAFHLRAQRNASRRGERLAAHEVRPCKDKRGVDLISDALPFGRADPRLR